jgi:GNAT superfamily N-acetyltransferase
LKRNKEFFWDNELKLGRETAELTAKIWPNYLVVESDIPEPGLKFEITQEEFVRRFPVWGIRRSEDKRLVAFANAVQVCLETQETLPSEGWRFAIQSGASGKTPNALCLVIANIDPSARGQGFGKVLIERAKQAARELGFLNLVAPVRPTLKHQEPLMPMTEYLLTRIDPWIKTHIESGGEVLNVCEESVVITATLNKWREWTGLSLQENGEHNLPHGLVPLSVDLQKGIGIYREPNVWLRYRI